MRRTTRTSPRRPADARAERRRIRRSDRAEREMRFLAAGPAGYPFISRRPG